MSRRVKQTPRYPKTKTSKRFCQEKFACEGEETQAEYECEECDTLQCADCDVNLHQLNKFIFHERHKIQPPSPNKLCQATCDNQNYADLRCSECSLNLCFKCFDKLHKGSGKKKLHKKLPFSLTELSRDLPVAENISSPDSSLALVLEPSTSKDPVLPLSPIGGDALDSFYVSMPQADSGIFQFLNPSSKTAEMLEMATSDSSFSSIPDVAAINTAAAEPTRTKVKGKKKKENALDINSQVGHEHDNEDEIYKDCHCFLLADTSENLKVIKSEDFVSKLGCEEDTTVKVISIFGNTGDGKSHTLNHTFYGGHEIFKTSSSPVSCTVGVWAAFDPVHNAVTIDTEGLLGVTASENQRTRLLLKVMAISDLVIYRTRADRLHNDLFTFLGDASKAYTSHFREELKAASLRGNIDLPLSNLGPAVVVFHETQHTDVLGTDKVESPEALLRSRFQEMGRTIEAFSCLKYVGTRTNQSPTDFTRLLGAVKRNLRDTTVRSPRKPQVIFNALKVLNDKFSGEIEDCLPSTFPDQYFTCTTKCLACNQRCSQTMNHLDEDKAHSTDSRPDSRCIFQHQFENKVYVCKACYDRGQDNLVVPKTASSKENNWLGLATYVWSGYVLECPSCGIIYRSRQHWYGNPDPDKASVRTEIRHVWPGSNTVLQGTHNAARRMLDGVQYISSTISSVSAKPTKVVGNWVTDQYAPSYWRPNSQITKCHDCEFDFEEGLSIHHCRACGEGFCEECSHHKKPVPEKGWPDPVRVCNKCMEATIPLTDSSSSEGADSSQVTHRKVGEAVTNTVGAVTSFIKYPLGMVRDMARPTYWVPDEDIQECCVCKGTFGPKLTVHHCRACGNGVCSPCSLNCRAVPSRGWDHPVRVCNNCDKRSGKL